MIKRQNLVSFLKKTKKFGLLLPLTNVIILYGQKILGDTFCQNVANWRQCRIRKELDKLLPEFTIEEQLESSSIKNENNTIWTCWLQGEEQMPEIVKTCINSFRKFANGHNVVVLTFNNFHDYIELPPLIINKFIKGDIQPAHFTDILRLSIIMYNGGVWLDSTVLLIAPLNESFFKNNFYSIKHEPSGYYISQCQWTSYCFGGQRNNVLVSNVHRWFLYYLLNYDVIIDYFLMDYLFDKACRDNKTAKELIDAIPFSNLCIEKLNNMLEENNKETEFLKMVGCTSIFKLSWKNHTTALYSNKDNLYYFIKRTLKI